VKLKRTVVGVDTFKKFNGNDFINNVPPAPPLTAVGSSSIDASGGWWDAGDYLKYVETTSYTAALMQIGVRDFPRQMGPAAPLYPPAPPVSISFARDSGAGAPVTSDFTREAKFGIGWLTKMWNDQTKTLYYQWIIHRIGITTEREILVLSQEIVEELTTHHTA
jgi:endoglucanase